MPAGNPRDEATFGRNCPTTPMRRSSAMSAAARPGMNRGGCRSQVPIAHVCAKASASTSPTPIAFTDPPRPEAGSSVRVACRRGPSPLATLFSGGVEDGAGLEQPHVGNVAPPVVDERIQKARPHRWPQRGELLSTAGWRLSRAAWHRSRSGLAAGDSMNVNVTASCNPAPHRMRRMRRARMMPGRTHAACAMTETLRARGSIPNGGRSSMRSAARVASTRQEGTSTCHPATGRRGQSPGSTGCAGHPRRAHDRPAAGPGIRAGA